MSNLIIAQTPTTGKFSTVEDIVIALQISRETTFTAEIAYIGGHGDVLLARPEDEDIEVEMLVRANGRGWMLGQWGPRNFGHVDAQATDDLQQEVTRCRDCGTVISARYQYPTLGALCWDCLKRYAGEVGQ